MALTGQAEYQYVVFESDASQRVLDLIRGHPFLVQLLCNIGLPGRPSRL
jgi:hypothetical protein